MQEVPRYSYGRLLSSRSHVFCSMRSRMLDDPSSSEENCGFVSAETRLICGATGFEVVQGNALLVTDGCRDCGGKSYVDGVEVFTFWALWI